jgi:hypothetical protein
MTNQTSISSAILGLHNEQPTFRSGCLIHIPITQHVAARGEHGSGLVNVKITLYLFHSLSSTSDHLPSLPII